MCPIAGGETEVRGTCGTLHPMRCPTCGEPTSVVKSRPVSGNRVRRTRVCTASIDHRCTTIEQWEQIGLDGVGVRRSGDGELAEGSFDWERLLRDVRNGVLKSMPEGEVVTVCQAVVAAIEFRLPRLLQPLTTTEARSRNDLRGWIYDYDVSGAVERHLRSQRYRVAHVLYALTTRGRADREGRRGWGDAADFLRWLYEPENYPDLAIPLPAPGEGGPLDKWFPASLPSHPEAVIKRDGRIKPYLQPQFEASVRKALLGRPNALETAVLLVAWVLWGMHGQREVHSTQLAVGVLDCLRRVDDIAYLRWSAVAKSMTTVTQVRDEACALLSQPSARLSFDPALRPRRPDSARDAHR